MTIENADSLDIERDLEALDNLTEKEKKRLHTGMHNRIFLRRLDSLQQARNLFSDTNKQTYDVANRRDLSYQSTERPEITFPPPQASPIDYSRPSPAGLIQSTVAMESQKNGEPVDNGYPTNGVVLRENRHTRPPLRRRYSSPVAEERPPKSCRMSPPKKDFENSFTLQKRFSGTDSNLSKDAEHQYIKNSTEIVYTSENVRCSPQQQFNYSHPADLTRHAVMNGSKDSLSLSVAQPRTDRAKSDGDVASSIPLFIYSQSAQATEKNVFESEKLQAAAEDHAAQPGLIPDALTQIYPWLLARYLNKLLPDGSLATVQKHSPYLIPMTQNVTPQRLLSYYNLTSTPQHITSSLPSGIQVTSPSSSVCQTALLSPSHHTTALSPSYQMTSSSLSPSHTMTSTTLSPVSTKPAEAFPHVVSTSSRDQRSSTHSRPFASSSPDSGCPEVTESDLDSRQPSNDLIPESESHSEVWKIL